MATTQEAGSEMASHTSQPSNPGPLPAKEIIRIGTRRSILARLQADEVAKALKQACPQYTYEIHAMATTGDNNHAIALHKFNEKALWTQELEVSLQNGDLDFIVHCLKDMPTQLPIDLEIGCITARKDPRDALVLKQSLRDTYHGLADLPEGSVIGTSSLRRTAQLKRHHPHLQFADIRGAVGTRLSKLDNPESDYSAIIIAVAGLDRLGMSDRIATSLSKDNGGMLYAVGQGGLAIEVRKDDPEIVNLLTHISCERTTREGLAERSLMRTLEGGCSVPIGVETEWVAKSSFLGEEGSGVGVKPAGDYDKLTGVATSGAEAAQQESAAETDLPDEMIMRAIVVSLDGKDAAEVETRKMISSREEADQFGRDVARMLVERGAERILHEIQLNRGIIKDQGEA